MNAHRIVALRSVLLQPSASRIVSFSDPGAPDPCEDRLPNLKKAEQFAYHLVCSFFRRGSTPFPFHEKTEIQMFSTKEQEGNRKEREDAPNLIQVKRSVTLQLATVFSDLIFLSLLRQYPVSTRQHVLTSSISFPCISELYRPAQ